ncbi:MAG: carboxypeptidase-like regulatory domain-containing protein, partial [Chitinophagaceae bacterium]
AFSQRTISGKIVNAATSEPIAGSSVFISNTSFGTVTNKDGYFEITDIPSGKYDLIISSIGYETSVYNFSTDKLPIKLRVEMQVKVRELENVTIEPSVEEGWEKWGNAFLTNFVGQTANAKNCKIKNEKSIRFRFFRKSNRLVAYSDEPIILENKALGYIIKYQLENFEVNYKTHTTLFVGYPLFEEIDKHRKGLQRRWQKNRDKAYYGSMMHFMQSIYNNNLAAEGFEVRRMVREPNLEKQRIKKLYRPARLTGSVKIVSNGNRPLTIQTPDSLSTDSSAYYERILSQEDNIDTYGRALLNADSLIAEQQGEFKILFFENYLYVTYKRELEDVEYLEYFHERRSPTFQRSHIWLQNLQPIAIDPNGSYFPPQEIFSMSYWGFNEKMSNLLPLDYKPYSPAPELKSGVIK